MQNRAKMDKIWSNNTRFCPILCEKIQKILMRYILDNESVKLKSLKNVCNRLV